MIQENVSRIRHAGGSALGLTALILTTIPAGAQEAGAQENRVALPQATAQQSSAVQQSDIAALRAQLQELQARLDKMEAEAKRRAEAATKANSSVTTNAGPPNTGTTNSGTATGNATNTGVPPSTGAPSGTPVTTRERVTLSGLLQVHGLGFFNQDSAFARRADTFRLRRAELRLTVPAITPRISGTIQLDPAKVMANTAANPLIRARDSLLQEIMISYLLNKS
ncbi:MAG: hypothetical protein JWN98_480, partial [Abditibacteriota bacterium]|nr:hypothetical protein [Abditibacteriota bacterium]